MTKSSSTIPLLIEKYKAFKHEHFKVNQTFKPLVEHGQQPKVLVIACSDSRVDPALLLGCELGELFVVRNVANLVPPYKQDPRHHGTSAALEFAVMGLVVTDIIVLGHSHCGGIRALMGAASSKGSDFITTWMSIAEPAKAHVLAHYGNCSAEEQAHRCEKGSLAISLNNLMSFPWIKKRVIDQQLSLHGWFFNLETGEIEAYNEEKKDFLPL
ncbi:MAG: carbonic anhydrase [Gammaproteobacteria bacterium]